MNIQEFPQHDKELLLVIHSWHNTKWRKTESYTPKIKNKTTIEH